MDKIPAKPLNEVIWDQLKIGNNDPIKLGLPANSPLLPGATRFTDAQAKWFTSNYEIVTHYPNDASGFSTTLFKCIKIDPISGAKAGEFTLSFRRTEYQLQAKGGDYEADGSDATDGDIGAVKGVSVSLFSELR